MIAIAGLDAASAADLPVRAYTKAPVIADPTYNLTSGYIGVNTDGARGSANSSTSKVISPAGYFFPENVLLINAATVIIVNEDRDDAGEASSDQIVSHLARRGIKAQIERLTADRDNV